MHTFLLLSACISSIGGLLFGFDVGVISGIMEISAFQNRFDITSTTKKNSIVASLILCCFVGSFAAGFLADQVGRRKAIMLGATTFLVGGILQASAFGLAVFYFGRLIVGLAVGMLSVVVPLYLSEISPKEMRGSIVSIQQLAIIIGTLSAFFVNYGTNKLTGETSFRIPLSIECVFAIFMLVGMISLPASPRWLMSKGRTEDAARSLGKFRDLEDYNAELQIELDEIQDSLRTEYGIGKGGWKDLSATSMRSRLTLGISVQIFQQLTGISAIIYYVPKIMEKANIDNSSIPLLSTVSSGAVSIFMTLVSMVLIDRIGRRKILVSGSLLMALVMSILGILLAIHGSNSESAIIPYVCLAMACIFVGSFAYSWGPIGWVYLSEIYPLRIRAKSIALAAATGWFFQFCISQIAPILLETISWGTFVIFAAFGVIMAIFVLFLLPETKGKSLEEMDELFGHSAAEVAVANKMAAIKGY